jgi:hypothetical protein
MMSRIVPRLITVSKCGRHALALRSESIAFGGVSLLESRAGRPSSGMEGESAALPAGGADILSEARLSTHECAGLHTQSCGFRGVI